MGLQQRTYAIATAPDWTLLAKTLEGTTGVRVRAVPAGPKVVTIRARAIGGAAHVWFGDGRLEWEASLGANAYFLEHLDRGLVTIGATPVALGGAETAPAVRRWRELPLRVRISQGLVGQLARGLAMLALSPLLLVGLVIANAFVAVRKAVRRKA